MARRWAKDLAWTEVVLEVETRGVASADAGGTCVTTASIVFTAWGVRSIWCAS